MVKPPKPSSRLKKARATIDAVADRAIVPKPTDPRQAALFDSPLPKWIKPCLPTLVSKPPTGPEWVHEIKWDGYRVSAYVAAGKVTIRTRNGHNWTERFPTIAAGIAALKVRSAVIDGEAVILDEKGRSNFAELQAALAKSGARQALLYAFDLLFLDGEDLRDRPLEERRDALARVIRKASPILMSQEYAGAGADLFKVAGANELEGIVSKRIDQPYRSGRSKTWLKTKCVLSGTFVIVGYQPTSGAVRGALANLKLARMDGGKLVFVGTVGTGFSDAVARMMRERLDRLVTPKCAVPGLKAKGAVWVRPELEAEIAYRGVTADGELRHASFKRLVDD